MRRVSLCPCRRWVWLHAARQLAASQNRSGLAGLLRGKFEAIFQLSEGRAESPPTLRSAQHRRPSPLPGRPRLPFQRPGLDRARRLCKSAGQRERALTAGSCPLHPLPPSRPFPPPPRRQHVRLSLSSAPQLASQPPLVLTPTPSIPPGSTRAHARVQLFVRSSGARLRVHLQRAVRPQRYVAPAPLA